MKKRLLSLLLALVMVFALLPMTASAASYASDYRYWSQGSSDYSLMRQYGCWVTAMAKLIYETGVDRSASFNPDRFAEWEVNNGYVNNLTNNLNQTAKNGTGYAPQAYAAAKGKSVEFLGNWAISADQLWYNINAGYYSIVKVKLTNGYHYIYLDNAKSRATGELYIDESSSDNYYTGPRKLSAYSNWVSVYTYKLNGTVTPPSTDVTMTWSKQTAESITQTNAKISATATASVKGNFTAASVKLWDSAGKLVGQKSESASYNLSYMNVFYDINSELGVKLKPGTTYKYQFTVTFNGKTYTSPSKTFTTSPCSAHSYGAWKTTKAATCTTTGTKTHTCTACGKTETQTIAMLGHNYVDGVCTRCGDIKLAVPTVAASNVASTGKIKLTWNAVDNAAKYYVYRSTSKSGTYSKIGTATATSYTDKTAKAGTKYYYKLKTVTADGTISKYSDAVARTCDCAKPVVTASNTASTGLIKLSWDKISGAEKYYVYRATSKSGDYSKIGSTTSTSYTDKKAKAGKKYYYKVKAICENTDANSAYSAIVSRTCDLARPTVSIKLSSGQPKLSWGSVDKALNYEIYRATSPDGTYKPIIATRGTSYTDKSAKAGKTYYYKVKAFHSNDSANSAYSTVVKIKAK